MSEIKQFHPVVAEWLTNNGYEYNHEVNMPVYGRADFVATSPLGEVYAIECKPDEDIKKGIIQAVGYAAQIENCKPAIAILSRYCTDEIKQMADSQGVMVIEFNITEDIWPSRKRYRLRYFFWLDLNKKIDVVVADIIELLKNERGFTQAIRDGLKLIWSLKQHDTSVLFELFPWLQDRILSPATRQLTRADRDDMLELLRLYDEYRRQSSAYAEYSHNGNGNGAGPKALSVPAVSLPDFDDDDIEIDIHKDTRTDSAANFLKSLEALQG